MNFSFFISVAILTAHNNKGSTTPRMQKKRIKKEPEIVYYEIEIDDWELECSFGLSCFPEESGNGDSSEVSNLLSTPFFNAGWAIFYSCNSAA